MRKLRFLISLPTSKNDFQLAQALSAEQTAQKRAIDLEIVYADNDAIQQSTQVLKAIQVPVGARPDAIVIEPASGTALPQVARAACAAGIGWAVLNRAPDYISELRRTSTAPIFSISSDHLEIGRIQGRQFAALLPSGGSVLYIEGPSHSSSAKNRTLVLRNQTEFLRSTVALDWDVVSKVANLQYYRTYFEKEDAKPGQAERASIWIVRALTMLDLGRFL